MKKRIMVIGSAWGNTEYETGRAFSGTSGRFLMAMLHQVGIDPKECYFTYVFNLKPYPTTDIKNLCGTKAEGVQGLPALTPSRYLLPKYMPEIQRLNEEIERVNPNIIIGLGKTPLWALFQNGGIQAVRGTTMQTDSGHKFMATVDPHTVLVDYKNRPIFLSDLTKAERESHFPEVRRPNRELWIEPTIKDIWDFHNEYIVPAEYLSIDIETAKKEITCFGVAPSRDRALVIPFHDSRKPDNNYWASLNQELRAWKYIRYLCSMPDKKTVGQNFMYDMRFLWEQYGIPVTNAADDTMLLHHALQPEMKKGLGFLASIYTDEASWKFMRTKDTKKKED